jgi:hypothetical protein
MIKFKPDSFTQALSGKLAIDWTRMHARLPKCNGGRDDKAFGIEHDCFMWVRLVEWIEHYQPPVAVSSTHQWASIHGPCSPVTYNKAQTAIMANCSTTTSL